MFGNVLRKMTAPTGYEAREKCIIFAIQHILLWCQIEDKVRNMYHTCEIADMHTRFMLENLNEINTGEL